jgi:PAS domain-containing protein
MTEPCGKKLSGKRLRRETPTNKFDFRIVRSNSAAVAMLGASGQVRYVEARGEAVFNGQGQVVKLFGTSLDITDRKRTEATLQEAERRWRSLLENVQLLVVGLDRMGNVEYVNRYFFANVC